MTDPLREDELFGLAARNLIETWPRLSPAKRAAARAAVADALAAIEAAPEPEPPPAPERTLFGPELRLVRVDGEPPA